MRMKLSGSSTSALLFLVALLVQGSFAIPPTTAFVYESDSSDPIGFGFCGSLGDEYVKVDAVDALCSSTSFHSINISTNAPTENWSIFLSATLNNFLFITNFENAIDSPTLTNPGLSVFGNGRVCPAGPPSVPFSSFQDEPFLSFSLVSLLLPVFCL